MKEIPANASEIPESKEKPVDHNSQHGNHLNVVVPEDSLESSDEDVEYLNRLEEELVINRFFNKYLHSLH